MPSSFRPCPDDEIEEDVILAAMDGIGSVLVFRGQTLKKGPLLSEGGRERERERSAAAL